ncbi:unnamed protein product [Chondrus crispus]|uniref:DDE Tnp4 domain-containing protein n=1 Tax=Chondrus crispus TaxID=2769 RepID=R7QIM3_CHOCR|nr:unnamed protein product [Chondrus crispus]CDF37326.1 unnamed protein product [Chondrus crispus]|eukprot:XP_005717145.1 unnamed protein product [Chondrus crispus]
MEGSWWNDAIRDEDEDLIQDLLDSSSEDEPLRRWGGSVAGKAPNIERGRIEASNRLYNQYFSPDSTYTSAQFQRRFRLSRTVFDRVHSALALEHFVRGVSHCFASEYLRAPTLADLKRLLSQSQERGFPGILGSMECCKWMWKNCPTAWHGQFQGKERDPAVTLEAVTDHSLWIWHAFFGIPGSANDVNVLEASSLLNKIATGEYPPPIEYTIAGKRRNIPYWLADGVYPRWPSSVQTVLEPRTSKEKCMSRNQEHARKDVERAFGVLQAKWHIIARLSRFWSKQIMKEVIECCIILHNMMVENRKNCDSDDAQSDDELQCDAVVGNSAKPMWSCLQRSGAQNTTVPPPGSLAALFETNRLLKHREEYFTTQRLIMDHLWDFEGKQI